MPIIINIFFTPCLIDASEGHIPGRKHHYVSLALTISCSAINTGMLPATNGHTLMELENMRVASELPQDTRLVFTGYACYWVCLEIDSRDQQVTVATQWTPWHSTLELNLIPEYVNNRRRLWANACHCHMQSREVTFTACLFCLASTAHEIDTVLVGTRILL